MNIINLSNDAEIYKLNGTPLMYRGINYLLSKSQAHCFGVDFHDADKSHSGYQYNRYRECIISMNINKALMYVHI